MLNFDRLELSYRPFPVGVIRPAMSPDLYAECLRVFPEVERFRYLEEVGHKWSLSEKNAARNYEALIRDEPVWREFHRWIKSREFLERTFEALCVRGVDLGYEAPRWGRRTAQRARCWWRGRGRPSDFFSARFEFSMLPAAGGCVFPHTDNPEKIVTVVISMVGEGDWSSEYGGGTDILQPTDERLSFDRLNDRRPDFKDFEIVHTHPYASNQAVVFVKTFNSWHAVRPMTGPGDEPMRRTLTINIETR